MEPNKLQEALLEQVTNALPGLVGTQLRGELNRLYDIEKEYQTQKEKLDQFTKEFSRVNEINSKLSSENNTFKGREEAIAKTEQRLALREGLIELRETHVAERIGDNLRVTMAVFANSKLKYMENSNGSANNMSTYINRTIEQQET
jgi:predicted nuclease with TOPRIM domain